MKERPILFSGPMVRAILDGRKTQARRPVKPQPFVATPSMFDISKCPIGKPGDRLWVRETWRTGYLFGMPRGQERQIPIYRADGISIYPAGVEINFLWRPSIHMPRWASRITLEIVRVWVEMVQDITEEDAKAEGCCGGHSSIPGYAFSATPREHFRHIWQSIYGTWEANPFVWAVEFRRVK